MGYAGRIFYRIWFFGAAVWFFDALLSMHHHALGRGIAQSGIAAAFLIVGMLFRKQYLRRLERLRKREQERQQNQGGGPG